MNKINYKNLVEKARKLVAMRNTMKYEIAKIAIEVCSSTVGGKESIHAYSLQRFAEDIGVHPKALYRWRREYEVVISKIGSEKKLSRKALEETLKKTKKDTPKAMVEKIYNAEEKRLSSAEDHKVHDFIKRLKNIDFYFNHSLVLSKADRSQLEIARELSKSIYFGLDNYLSGNKRPAKPARERALERIAALTEEITL